MLYESLLTKLKDNKAVNENLILTGAVSDFTEYKYILGRLKGILESIEMLEELFKKGEEDGELR